MAHSKNKPAGFFSKDFRQLVTGLLQFNPALRFTISDVIATPWYKDIDNMPSGDYIFEEFYKRKGIISKCNQMQAIEETK